MKKIILGVLATAMSSFAYSGVTIYENSYYSGATAYIADGEMIDGLQERGIFANDSVTSLKVDPGSCVVLWQNSGYNGDVRFYRNGIQIPDLKDFANEFNDQTSSIQVFRIGPNNECGMSVMTSFYYNANYNNHAFSLPPYGTFHRNLASGNWNRRNGVLQHADNSISSVRVPTNVCVTLYDNADFMGASQKLDANTPDLVPFQFNDRASSVRLSGGAC